MFDTTECDTTIRAQHEDKKTERRTQSENAL